MFALPQPPQPKRRPTKGIRGFLESWYYDPFRWQLVTSWGFFFGGVFFAQEIAQINFNSPATV